MMRPDYLSPSENYIEGLDFKDPRLLSMDNDSIVNNVPDKKIDERFLQLCNKYPFVNISPKLYQSQIYLPAGMAKDFWQLKGFSRAGARRSRNLSCEL